MFSGLAIQALQPLIAAGIQSAQPVVEPLFEPPDHEAREEAYQALQMAGVNPCTEVDLLVVIDFDRPSYERRLAIYERGACPIRYCLVSHGIGSGNPSKLFADGFSNQPGSNQTSLGLFQVGWARPSSKFGTSIELDGLQPGLNHLARPRKIVMHPAWYVSYDCILTNVSDEGCPRLGQSRGCPALSAKDFAFFQERTQEVQQGGGNVFLYAYSSRGGSSTALGLKKSGSPLATTNHH